MPLRTRKEVIRMARFLRKPETRGGRKEDEPNGADKYAARLVTVLYPMSPASEAYRTLRTNLLYAFMDDPPQAIVLTSPGPGEGKSTACANIGVVLAQAGKNVLIVDCDLRNAVMHKFFRLRNLYGLVDVLLGERDLKSAEAEPVEGLKVLPVGPTPHNPTELLGTQRFSELLTSFRKEFDYVLIDAPPVMLVSDPAILATQGDGVLLILDAQNTRKASVRQSIRSLKVVGANVLGTVVNNVTVSGSSLSFVGDYYYK
jgi:receptor protein-tyrosine kinase